jgi:hypothetical protein
MAAVSCLLLLFFHFGPNSRGPEGEITVFVEDEDRLHCDLRADLLQMADGPGEDEEYPCGVTVVVRSDAEGGIARLAVRTISGKEVEVGGLAGLTRHLVGARPGVGSPEAARIRCDCRLGLQALVRVMDACRAAGFDDLRLAPPDN